MQPLDVGYFGPLKGSWKKQITTHSDKDPSAKVLAKTEFPRMLKELVDSVDAKKLLPKAFEKCGLFPLNRQKVLERIPSVEESQQIARNVDSILLKKLEVRRFGEGGKKKPRGKKIPAGQSYTEEPEESSKEESSKDESSEEESEEEDSENEDDVREDSSPARDRDNDGQLEDEENEDLPDLLPTQQARRKAGTFVVALYEGEWFLAQVCEEQEDVAVGYTRLSYMVLKGRNCFAWGEKPDLVVTLEEDIILEKLQPDLLNSRGHMGLNKKDLKSVLSIMVVVFLHLFSTNSLPTSSCLFVIK
jgi:hypothetical protein